MTILTTTPLYTLVILTTGATMISAKSMGDILNHLGGLPKCYAIRTIYSHSEPTFEEAETLADFPDFNDITAHVNLI